MGRPAGWMKELTGRAPMKSPGHPTHPSGTVERWFWRGDRDGLSMRGRRGGWAGFRPAAGVRWFRRVAGCQRSSPRSRGGTCRSRSGRRSRCLGAGVGVREIARRLGRSPSTISRELRRNAATRGGKLEYRATVAQWHAERRRGVRRPRSSRRTRGCASMCRSGSRARSAGPTGRRSPGPQTSAWIGRVTGRVARTAGGRRRGARSRSRTGCGSTSPMMSRCGSRHEAIYQSLYVQGRGALRRELTACLRTGRALRVPRARAGRGKSFVTERDHDQRAAR